MLWFYWLTGPPHPQVHPELSCQAQSWLDGHWYIEDGLCQQLIGEKIWHNQHSYIVHPPGGAVLMLGAHLFRVGARATGCLIGALSVVLCLASTSSWWLTALFAVGTNFWYESSAGLPWGMTSVVSTVPTWLALSSESEMLRGFWAGLAALSRYELLMAWPLYTTWGGKRRLSVINLTRFMAGVAPSILFYLVNAHFTANSWWDSRIAQWYWHDGHRINNDGPFSIGYIPWNLYTTIYMAPQFNVRWPWLRPTTLGQSILTTSPALVLCLAPTLKRSWPLLMTICLVMAGPMMVWSNGYAQWGARYWIMVYPLIISLIALEPASSLLKVSTCFSVLFQVYGIWFIRFSGQQF